MTKSPFTDRPFAVPVDHQGTLQGLWGHDAVNGINKDVSGTNDCLDLSCGLSLFLSLTEHTALLPVSWWKVYPAFSYPPTVPPYTLPPL